jgi:toxin CcdB
MAQFSVYRNRNARSKNTYPLLVDVQSNLLEELQTRVVIPLSKAAGLTRKPVSHLMPLVDFEESTYLVLTPQLAGIQRSELGPAIGSLAHNRDTILAALDFLLTGF